MQQLYVQLVMKSVKTTYIENESTEVLCSKQNTIWYMTIRQAKSKYYHIVRH